MTVLDLLLYLNIWINLDMGSNMPCFLVRCCWCTKPNLHEERQSNLSVEKHCQNGSFSKVYHNGFFYQFNGRFCVPALIWLTVSEFNNSSMKRTTHTSVSGHLTSENIFTFHSLMACISFYCLKIDSNCCLFFHLFDMCSRKQKCF